MIETLASLWVLWVLFLIFMLISWFLLPFALWGMKKRLNSLHEESRRTNALLERLSTQLPQPRGDRVEHRL